MEDIYELHSDCCKIFSNPSRLKILDLLREEGKTVTQLTEETGLNQSNVSQHISLMRDKGIIKGKREGRKIEYELTSEKVIKAFDLIKEFLIEQHQKNRKILQEK